MLVVAVFLFLLGCVEGTTRPIIGILDQPVGSSLRPFGSTYIAASYVKFMEAAGARVVPIFHTSSKAELKKIFESVNGILFPGGGSDLNGTPLYEAGKYLVELATEANDNGVYFPIQGHCMGFELIHMIISRNMTILTHYDAENITLPLLFSPVAKTSRMFSSAPQQIMDILAKEPVTMNNHQWGVGDAQYGDNSYLSGFFNILSRNKDREGNVFISTVEGKKYPIYALQWHAEKPLFEWNPDEVIQHTPDAVKSMQYMADFFVSEARKNDHKFTSAQDEYSSLIWNYSPKYTSKIISDFDQCYIF